MIPGTNGAHGQGASASTADLRAIVREALTELLASHDASPVRTPMPATSAPVSTAGGTVEAIAVRNDAELTAFVMRLLHLFENPKHRDDLRTGRLRFRLDGPPGPGSYQPSHRIENGAVTEKSVRQAAKSGARLVLGARAVLTPLARDRARAEGVVIEKERS